MSHNQQGVPGAIYTNFDMSYDNWVTNTQSGWIPHNDQPASLYQTKQWPDAMQQVWQSTGFHPNTQIYHDWGQQSVGDLSLNVMQQAVPYAASKQLPTKTFAPNHQSRIAVPNTNGGFKAAIIKRKRKRTMFTTEQIQTLESFFKNKPYITREERQIFVDNLHLSDSAVKVWFQNRRLREKRDREEREAEALELANSLTEETFYYSQNNANFEIPTPTLSANTSDLSKYFSVVSFDDNPVTVSTMEMGNTKTTKGFDIDNLLNATYVKMTECYDNRNSQNNEDSGIDSDSSRLRSDSISNMVIDSNTDQQERVNFVESMQKTIAIVDSNESSSSPSLDAIEADIEKKTDEFGYVTLDDKAMGNLVSVLSNALPNDVDLGSLSIAEETAEDSDSTTYAGSIYEPISPVVSDIDEEFLKAKWEPFAPEKSLQRLFDLHFC